MARYSFLTTWVVAAEVGPVWDVLYETSAWPEWWPGVTKADELVPRAADGTGGVTRFAFRSRLPYELTFEMRSTRVDRHRVMEGVASGELAGLGRWRFFTADGATAVLYEWDVETTARWLNALSPIGRTFFSWNHDHVMRAGAHGLGRLLGARILAAS
jgi:hypothetical protein